MPMCTNLWTNDSCPSLPRGCDWKVELSVVSVSSSFTTLSEYQNTIILGSTLNYYTARMPASKLNLVHDWLTDWLTADCWLHTAHCTVSIKSSVTIYINKKYYRMTTNMIDPWSPGTRIVRIVSCSHLLLSNWRQMRAADCGFCLFHCMYIGISLAV